MSVVRAVKSTKVIAGRPSESAEYGRAIAGFSLGLRSGAISTAYASTAAQRNALLAEGKAVRYEKGSYTHYVIPYDGKVYVLSDLGARGRINRRWDSVAVYDNAGKQLARFNAGTALVADLDRAAIALNQAGERVGKGIAQAAKRFAQATVEAVDAFGDAIVDTGRAVARGVDQFADATRREIGEIGLDLAKWGGVATECPPSEPVSVPK